MVTTIHCGDIRSLALRRAVRALKMATQSLKTALLMKSRRRIAFSKAQDHANSVADYSRDGGMGFGLAVHSSNPSLAMSALGQKRTLQCILVMSALPPKADIDLGVLRSPLRAISGRSGDRWI